MTTGSATTGSAMVELAMKELAADIGFSRVAGPVWIGCLYYDHHIIC
jgi:hypothetical protein